MTGGFREIVADNTLTIGPIRHIGKEILIFSQFFWLLNGL
jgi:hypothetical protein